MNNDNTIEKRAGFTPGPLHVQLLSESKKLPYVIINDNIDVIARVHSEPDAHLIASAPELHEALREILTISLRVDDLAWAEAVGNGNGIGPCDKARLALARADGGAEA